MAEPDPYWQSYTPFPIENCEYFWPLKDATAKLDQKKINDSKI